MDVGGGFDLSDFDVGDFYSPATGLLVETRSDELVDALALREDFVQAYVADDGSEGCCCKSDDCRGVVFDFQDGFLSLVDVYAHVDEEVDVDRSVVLGDVCLAGNLQDRGSGVDLLYLVDDGYGDDDARSFHPAELA